MRNFMGYDRRWLDEPHVGDHVGRTVWALGEILDGLGAGGRRTDARTCSTALVGRSPALISLRTAAYTMPRPFAPRRRPARPARPGTCSNARSSSSPAAYDRAARPTSGAGSRTAAATTTPASARRSSPVAPARSAAPTRPSAGSSRSRWLGDSAGCPSGTLRLAGPPRPTTRRASPGGSATSSHSTRPHFVEAELAAFAITGSPNTACAPGERSTGSSAATGSSDRSTTSRRAAAATASAASTSNLNEGAESTLCLPPRPRRCSTLPASGAAIAERSGRGGGGVSASELFERHPGNPILTASEWPYPVNAVLQSSRRARQRCRRSCSRASRTAAVSPI